MCKLKSVVLATTALMVIPSLSMAADYSYNAPVDYYNTPAVATNYNDWSGPYAGLYVGYGWGRFETNRAGDMKDHAAKLGAFGGFNFQNGNVVYGVEADAGYSWIEENKLAYVAKQGFDGSVRGRLGIASDIFMPYATLGLAASQVTFEDMWREEDKMRFGWTAGVGAEAKITQNIIGRVEYRHTNFGDKNYHMQNTTINSDLTTNDLRVGIGYKF